MASRGLTISGSGTVSTRTSWRPCQVNARIDALLDSGLGRGFAAPARRRRVGCDFARLHQRLEPVEGAPRVDVRRTREQLGDALADDSARGIVMHNESNHRPSVESCIEEFD